MKSISERLNIKTPEIQGVKSAGYQAQSSSQVESEDSLMEEFASLLDKISHKLDENAKNIDQQGIFAAMFAAGEIKVANKVEVKQPEKKSDNEKSESSNEGSKEVRSEDTEKSSFEAKVITSDKSKKEVVEKESSESKVQKNEDELSKQNAQKVQSDKDSEGQQKNAEHKNCETSQPGDMIEVVTETEAEVEEAPVANVTVKTQVEAGAKNEGKAKNADEKVDASLKNSDPLGQEIAALVREKLQAKPENDVKVDVAEKFEDLKVKEAKGLEIAAVALGLNEIKDISALLLGARPSMLSKESVKQLLESTSIKAVGSVSGSGNSNSAYASVLTGKNSESVRNMKVKEAPLTHSQALRSMEKVEAALKEVAKAKDGRTISLRLDPPELGAVKIDVTIKDGGLHARMSADSSSVSQLLSEKVQELQSILKKAGLNVDKITVSVNPDASAENFSQQLNSNQQGNTSDFNRQSGTPKESKDSFGDLGVVAKGSAEVSVRNIYDHWVA